MKFGAFVFALLLLIPTAFAQPTPEEFLGYSLGTHFTPHHRILEYFDELDRRSELVSVERFGETYERRPLTIAVITSTKNRAQLEQIRRDVATLAAGEGNVDEIARRSPAIVWLAFGVHGNESSSAEAAMAVASTLLREEQLLENLVVVIDPLQNPDGRERYIEWYRRTRGMQPNPAPESFEHSEPWPGGRFNHYLIDMNRDWAWQSQRESQARVALYQRWNPQVIVDFHEMSSQSTYFFPPDAKPINANLPRDVEKWLETFGRANAEAFTKNNWTFFVAEYFDLFYPGYGDSWPSLRGAIGMTYEVAGGGRGGTTIEREDGTILTLADRIQRHYTTGMATLRTAATNRAELLRYTHAAARTQIENGKNTFLILPGSPNFPKLIDLLQRQAIRVEMLSAPASLRATSISTEAAETRTFPAGTAVINTRQPLGALVQTLLEREATFSKGFLEEQRNKALADESDDFYDLTAWSLPLAMNVDAYVTTAAVTGTAAYAKPAAPQFRTAAYGYLVDGFDPNLYRFVGRLLATNVRFGVSSAEVPVGEENYARGSLVILKGGNDADLDARLEALVRETGVTVHPLQSGWTGGVGFGSDRVRTVRQPKIGLVGGAGTGATSFGMLWHTLDVDTPIPHTVLAAESLRNIDLAKYEVLLFPDGSYADRLGKSGVERIKDWVSGGGTVVAVGNANAFLREKDVEISKLKPWEPAKRKEGETPDAQSREARYTDFRIPGSAFRTSMNERSFLTFGVQDAPVVMIEGSQAYQPATKRIDNIITIDAKEPLVSGVAWPESIERLKGAPYLVRESFGRGQVITFADEPHFRLFWRGTLPLLLNAVVYGPTFAR
ncbi:MAG TPA: M14 metallopeptidase family protein [Thermoanaerobaculia bacterium]